MKFIWADGTEHEASVSSQVHGLSRSNKRPIKIELDSIDLKYLSEMDGEQRKQLMIKWRISMEYR